MSLLLLTTLMNPAQACGGFFCDQGQPVIQNAERVVFAIDEQAQEVEAHVQIFYQGDAEDFAWIVPIPSEPVIFESTQALFDTLAIQTLPTFSMRTVDEGNCREPMNVAIGGSKEASMAFDSATSTTGSVTVVGEQEVGPYDTVTLKAQSTDALLTWLLDNDYDIPAELEPLLEPYVSEDAHFLALKLQSDRSAGDIAPIAFRYPGDRASLPIQLTSVAAAPDTRLEIYVFADARATPESYLHVQLNDAAIDWWSNGSNYNDLISRAADEAGGHAFATDFSGNPDAFRGLVESQAQFSDPDASDAAIDDAERLFSAFGHLTRMTSSLDAAEMTVDPVFVQNADLSPQRVSVSRSADLVYECTGGKRRSKAIRRLELESGLSLLLPSEQWMAEFGYSEYEFLEDFHDINALQIEETEATLAAAVMVDHLPELKTRADAHNEWVRSLMNGCGGCSASSPAPVGGLLLGLGALVGLRRRQR